MGGARAAACVLGFIAVTLCAAQQNRMSFYVEPNTTAGAEALRLRKQGLIKEAQLLEKIASHAQARWFGNWNTTPKEDVHAYVSAAAAQGTIPVLVVYNIPDRDCQGHSAGGASSAQVYREWIGQVALGIAGRQAMVILEPDALAQLTCLSASHRIRRSQLISEAVALLHASGGASVYLDAGHADWVAVDEMAQRLSSAGLAHATGFALNVSNFHTVEANVAYGDRIAALTGKRYIVDTSRAGRGSSGAWCNPRGRGLGTPPTFKTGRPFVDAYVWVKRPGESDGACAGGPRAGTWWQDYALELARNAAF